MGSDEGEAIEFLLRQFSVFDFQNILATDLATRYIHDQGDRARAADIDSQHLHDLQRPAGWNVVDDSAVADRCDTAHFGHYFTFFGTLTPRLLHKSAILVGTPLKACSK